MTETLLKEQLATCVNQLPNVVSSYRWHGQIIHDKEVLLLIKTPASRFESLARRLLEIHPYELPELIAVPVTQGHRPYLDWVCQLGSTPPGG